MEAKKSFHQVVIFTFLLVICVSGCVAPAPPVASAHPNARVTDSGYALLYDLMGNEKDVSKLSIIKHERPEFHDLIRDISDRCGAAYDLLGDFAKADPSLNIKDQQLPLAEMQTRQREGKARGADLLTDKGRNLELQLMLTQNEAITYASHLSAVIAESETNVKRAQAVRQMSTDFSVLEERIHTMLLTNYMWSADK